MSNPSTLLDALLMKIVQANGQPVPTRAAINFTSNGFACTDNPDNDSTDIAFNGAGGPLGTGIRGTTVTGQDAVDWVTVAGGGTVTLYTLPSPALALGELCSMAALVEFQELRGTSFGHIECRGTFKNIAGSIVNSQGGSTSTDVTSPPNPLNAGAGLGGVTAMITSTGGTLIVQIFSPSTPIVARCSVSWIRGGGYVPPVGVPVISQILPAYGSAAGGEPITIIGAGFIGLTHIDVTIGGVAVQSSGFTVVSDNEITCKTPAGTASTTAASVVATNGFGSSLPYSFFFLPSGYLALLTGDAGVTVTSGHITAWADQTGNFTAVNDGTGPTVAANYNSSGRNALALNGSQAMQIAGMTVAQPFTIFVVMDQSASTIQYVFDGAHASSRCALSVSAASLGTGTCFELYALSSPIDTSSGQTFSAPMLVEVLFNAASSQVKKDNGPNLLSGNPGPSGLDSLEIGASSGGGIPFLNLTGHIAAILIYPSALSSGVTDIVHAVMSAVWGTP